MTDTPPTTVEYDPPLDQQLTETDEEFANRLEDAIEEYRTALQELMMACNGITAIDDHEMFSETDELCIKIASSSLEAAIERISDDLDELHRQRQSLSD